MSTRVKVTANMFRAVKIMLKGGATIKECAEYMGMSEITASRINRAETYEEYKHLASIAYMMKKEKEVQKEEKKEEPKETVQVVEHRQNVTIQATHYMMEEYKKMNELLTLISNKLSFIVDSLQ